MLEVISEGERGLDGLRGRVEPGHKSPLEIDADEVVEMTIRDATALDAA